MPLLQLEAIISFNNLTFECGTACRQQQHHYRLVCHASIHISRCRLVCALPLTGVCPAAVPLQTQGLGFIQVALPLINFFKPAAAKALAELWDLNKLPEPGSIFNQTKTHMRPILIGVGITEEELGNLTASQNLTCPPVAARIDIPVPKVSPLPVEVTSSNKSAGNSTASGTRNGAGAAVVSQAAALLAALLACMFLLV